jgi:hypothetical protein
MRNGNRANENEIVIFVFSVTTKHFPHEMLLPQLTGSTLPSTMFSTTSKSPSHAARLRFFQSGSLVGFESKCSFDISAAVYRMPPITLMVAARACSGRNLCQATTASRSVGQSVEIAPLWSVAGRLASTWIFASSLIIEESSSRRHPSPLFFRLSDEPFLNLHEDFVEPLFSTFWLLSVKLNLSF